MSRGGRGRQRPLAALLIESVTQARGPLPPHLEMVSLDDLMVAASDHRVGPAVWRRLRDSPGADPVWVSALGRRRQEQLLRHMRTALELKTIAAVFEDAGIGWVVAKGPVAADIIWPKPDMREYHDLDLFVGRRDFVRALEGLQDAGFTVVDRNWPEIARTVRAEIALLGPYGTPVDLHWDMAVPVSLRSAFTTDIPGMLTRARGVTLGSGLTVPTFDETDTVLHLAFHAAQAGATKLMWVGDLRYALAARAFDGDQLARRSARARAELPVALVLQRVREVLGIPVDMPDALERRSRGVWGSLASASQRRRPFPFLPGDRHAGGNIYSGARDSLRETVMATADLALTARRRERRIRREGPEGRILHRDVPDADAKRAYFEAVVGAPTR